MNFDVVQPTLNHKDSISDSDLLLDKISSRTEFDSSESLAHASQATEAEEYDQFYSKQRLSYFSV